MTRAHRGVSTVILFAASLPAAGEIDRTRPPETPPLEAYDVPAATEIRMPNGMRVITVEDRRFPLITLRMGFAAGSRYDPPELTGLSEMLGDMLVEGTANRSSREIAEQLAAMGGALSGQSTDDSLILLGRVLAERLPEMLDLTADVTRNAVFPEDELRLRRENRKQELRAQLARPDVLVTQKFREVVFGDHAYSRMLPTEESLDRIGRQQLFAFRDRHLRPEEAVLVLVGSLPDDRRMMELLDRHFGNWQGTGQAAGGVSQLPQPERRVVLVDRPGSVQADVRVGKIAISRLSPEYYALLVANTIAGGGASSRIFRTIREEKGFAYQAASMFVPLKESGYFAALMQVRNEAVEPAITALLGELERMAEAEPPREEIEAVQNYLNGTFVLSMETPAGLASQILNVRLMDLPPDYLDRYVERIRAVRPEGVREVSGRYIAPNDAAIVVVGDANEITRPLEQFGTVRVEQTR